MFCETPTIKQILLQGETIQIASLWAGFVFIFVALSWLAFSCFACWFWAGFLFLFYFSSTFLDMLCWPFPILDFYFIFMQSFIAWANSTKITDIFFTCSINSNGEESFPSLCSDKFFLLLLLNYLINCHRTLVSQHSLCSPNFIAFLHCLYMFNTTETYLISLLLFILKRIHLCICMIL